MLNSLLDNWGSYGLALLSLLAGVTGVTASLFLPGRKRKVFLFAYSFAACGIFILSVCQINSDTKLKPPNFGEPLDKNPLIINSMSTKAECNVQNFGGGSDSVQFFFSIFYFDRPIGRQIEVFQVFPAVKKNVREKEVFPHEILLDTSGGFYNNSFILLNYFSSNSADVDTFRIFKRILNNRVFDVEEEVGLNVHLIKDTLIHTQKEYIQKHLNGNHDFKLILQKQNAQKAIHRDKRQTWCSHS